MTDITRDSGDGGVGTTYRQGERGPLGRRIDADFRVTECEVPRRYAYEVTTGPARPRAVFTLEPLDGGRTRLSFTLAWTPAGIARLIVPFVAKGMRRELADLDRLKRALETVATVTGSTRSRPPRSRSYAWTRSADLQELS